MLMWKKCVVFFRLRPHLTVHLRMCSAVQVVPQMIGGQDGLHCVEDGGHRAKLGRRTTDVAPQILESHWLTKFT